MEKKQGLCFRCEYRAKYLEEGIQPRCECGMANASVISCYMYKPVCPVILTPLNKKDKRPRFVGAMLSSREKFERIADGKIKGRNLKNDEVVLYWSNLK
jgi:hypothetical protein